MKRISFVLVLLLLANPSYAWNAAGHKAIALIAYFHLTPVTRSQVDSLLAKHPDYSTWTKGAAPQTKGRTAFLAASVWPDSIRNDRRFHEDNVAPTIAIPGLPPRAQARHSNWHYTNLPFSTDGRPIVPATEPNVLTALKDFSRFAQMSEQEKIYALPWILHLIGDVHQPLHVMAQFTKEHPQGDRGGNPVILNSGNLHSYWDSRITTSSTDLALDQLIALVQKRHPKPAAVVMSPDQWVQEGLALRDQVYAFQGLGTRQDPARLSDQYSVDARNIVSSGPRQRGSFGGVSEPKSSLTCG